MDNIFQVKQVFILFRVNIDRQKGISAKAKKKKSTVIKLDVQIRYGY